MESKPSLDLLYELYSAFAPRASDTTSTSGSGYRSLTFSSVAPNSNTEKAAAKPIATAGVSITASFPKPLKLAPLVMEKSGKPQSLLFGGSTQHDRFVEEGVVRQVTFPTKTVRDGASVELIPVMDHPVIKTLVEELTKHEISSVSDIVVLYGQKLRADDQGMSRNPTAFLVSAFNLPNREFRLLSLDVKKSTTSWYPSGEKYIDMHVDEDKTLHAATIYQRRLHSLKLDNHLVPQEESLLSYGIHLKHFIKGCVEVSGGIVQYAGDFAYSIENNFSSNHWNVTMVKKGGKNLSILDEHQFGLRITAIKVVANYLIVLDESGILSAVPLNKDGSVQPPDKKTQVYLVEKAQDDFDFYYQEGTCSLVKKIFPDPFNRLEATDQLIFVAMTRELLVLGMPDLKELQNFDYQRDGTPNMLSSFGAINGMKVLPVPGRRLSLLAVFFKQNWMVLFNINSVRVSANQHKDTGSPFEMSDEVQPLQYVGQQEFYSSQVYIAKVLRTRDSDLLLVCCRGDYKEDEAFCPSKGVWQPNSERMPIWCFDLKIDF